MGYFETIILAIIQGITEFLPVSSSAHLLIIQHIMGFDGVSHIAFDLVLHLGTLLALCLFFFKEFVSILDIRQQSNRQLIFYIIIATIITGVLGLILGKWVENFSSLIFLAIFLFITALLLLSTKNLKERNEIITLKRASFIGLIQGLAVIPGISRSGSTIVMGRYLGLNRKKAFLFSFMLSVPSILGATLLEGIKMYYNTPQSPIDFEFTNIVLGFIVSFITGYIALKVFVKIVLGKYFYIFGYYCIIVAIFSLVLGLLQ
jgi:undecaprenyl-diphosphatase